MKQKAEIIREVDKLGRVTLPAQFRQALDIRVNDPLSITLENDAIALRKAVPTCVFCGTTDNVMPFKGRILCVDCLRELQKLP